MAETSGGLGPAAVQLIHVLAQAGEELLAMWSREDVIRQLVGSVAMAVQGGEAMAYFYGHDRCLQKMHESAEVDETSGSQRESSRDESRPSHTPKRGHSMA